MVKNIYLLTDDKEKDLQVHLYEVTDLKSNTRNPILNKIKTFAGSFFVVFTVDYSEFFLSVIANNRAVTQKFNPQNPNIISIRWIDALADRSSFSPYETLNQMQSEKEYALLAEKIWKILKRPNYRENLIHLFISAGLQPLSPFSFILSRFDAPLRAGVQIIAPDTNPNELVSARLQEYLSGFQERNSTPLKIIIFLSNQQIYYYDTSGRCLKSVPLKDESLGLRYLESLIACIDNRCAFNAETFCRQFSIYSPIFLYSQSYLGDYYKSHKSDMDIIFREWSLKFEEVYKKEDIREPLFLKHSYLAHIIKTVLYIKYLDGQEKLNNESFLQMAEWFERKNVELFLNDFFSWTLSVDEVNEEIFYTLKGSNFEAEDIFRLIYQELVSPETRQALGEFYTPPALCRLMVEDAYEFGQRVLDPACGSGTFLSEIVTYITNKNKTDQEKLDALENLYGFDVNPIAVLVSKANLLLHLDFLLNDLQLAELPSYPINVYLCNSLFPIKKRKPPEDGKGIKKKDYSKYAMTEMEEFYMESIDESVFIPLKFFRKSHQNDFEHMLRILDAELVKAELAKVTEWDQLKANLKEKIDFPWLFKMKKGTFESYWEIFLVMAKKFFDLSQKKANHIWIYLLYNMIGVRKVRDDRVDLIIGNPPWLVLNKIHSIQYKETIKKLASDLGIMMGGKNATHTEMSSIFFNKCTEMYLKPAHQIFFVITNAIMTGDQHSKFRLFNGFKDIKILTFDEDVFRIHNICLSGIYGDVTLMERLKIPVTKIQAEIKKDRWILTPSTPEIFVPYNYYTINEDGNAKRLIPISELENLLPRGTNPYFPEFYQGASLVPRNLFFVIIKDKTEKISTISPNMQLQKQKPWDFEPYKEVKVESRYIFQVVKSTELVPFAVLGKFDVFLPIELEDYLYYPDRIDTNAKEHFKFLNTLYQEHQKAGASITDLWEQINYRNKLSNPNQHGNIKVLYNSTGSLVKSAIILNSEVIVDYKLYYISLQSLEEAYYLMGILNAPCITKDISFRGATGAGGSIRGIEKRPLDYKIPKYAPDNALHQSIVKKSRALEKLAQGIIKDWIEGEKSKLRRKLNKKPNNKIGISQSQIKLRPRTIQNKIYKELQQEFLELDNLIEKLLRND